MQAVFFSFQQSVPYLFQSRYGRLTPLAKTLQEDPSCQLCNVLHKYVLRTDISNIEENLSDCHLPALTILRQGVIVLSRQWKSVLYTPLLLDHNYKLRHLKPLNVTVAVPEEEAPGSDYVNLEENEVTDECAVLIDCEEDESEEKGKFIPAKIKYCSLRKCSNNTALFF